MTWDALFLNMCDTISQKSKDQSTKFGAVIVGPDNEVRSVGYNSFVRGINDTVEFRQTRPEKYYWFEHAERNAIYNAARTGVVLKGCRLYVQRHPCADCARAIIQSGIVEVILESSFLWDERWKDSIDRAMIMFREAGVVVRVAQLNI